MPDFTYLDFDLQIERTAKGYLARVLNSPAGQASVEFAQPFSLLELENFLLRVGRTRRVVRRLDSPEMQAVRAFGGKLFETVFDNDVRACLRSSQDEAERRGARLRLRLRLTGAPELADWPWEYVYNPSLNRFLSLSVETPLVRYLELSEAIRSLAVQPPLKVLVMISSPSDHLPLDVEREWQNLNTALAPLIQKGLLTLTRLDQATLAMLQRQLRRDDYHIFHFIGHGGFDEQAQEGVLLFEDEQARGRRVSGNYLGTILHDERTLRLVVLNACEGARASTTDTFAGTAQALVQQGMPAVIAMQFEVSDEAAIAFGQNFYETIALGYPVDAALSEARKAIFATGNELEWGTPVLYMRASDGKIFDVEVLSDKQTLVPEPPKSAVEQDYELGVRALITGQWEQAVMALRRVVAQAPNYRDAILRLAEAERQLAKPKPVEMPTFSDAPVADKTPSLLASWQTTLQQLGCRMNLVVQIAFMSVCVLLSGVVLFPILQGAATSQSGTVTPVAIVATATLRPVVVTSLPTLAPTPTPQPTVTPVPPTLVPTPAPVVTPAPLGLITFMSNRSGKDEVYVMRFDGTDVKKLTNFGPAGGPAWSPDGKQIIFDRDFEGDYEIYVMNADGTGQRQLTNNNRTDGLPSWSPDGKQIAFHSDRDGKFDIYVMDADGRNARRVTTLNGMNVGPKWSPDGRKLFFTNVRDNTPRIYSVNLDGSNVAQELPFVPSSQSPAWSPDGAKLAFVASEGGKSSIMLYDVRENRLHQLVSEGINDQPTWSPDGHYIAFVGERDRSRQIIIMRSDGSGQNRITFSVSNDQFPSWTHSR